MTLEIVPRPKQLRMKELDRGILLARLMRAQTDLYILSHDVSIGAEERDKLRLAAEVAGEVTL